jgi:hypothetical protein
MFDWLKYDDGPSPFRFSFRLFSLCKPFSFFFVSVEKGNKGESHFFEKREWSFTLQDDLYIRYLSFQTEGDFRAALVAKLPVKIDIGAVYNAPVTFHVSLISFFCLTRVLSSLFQGSYAQHCE